MTPEALFEKHLAWAAGIARSVHRKLPPPFELDDLVQHAHIALWKAAEKYKPHYGIDFLVFAHVYVQSACWMSIRRRPYREAMHCELTGGPPDPSPSVEEVLIRDEEAGLEVQAMREAVLRLPREQRQVIQLHYFEGVRMVEVAPTMGISLTAAYTLRQQAVKAMKGDTHNEKNKESGHHGRQTASPD